MGARYLNCSELVFVRYVASEALRRRRPRRALRVRAFVDPWLIPVPPPRRPLDDQLGILVRVLDGLRALPEVA